LSNSTAVSPYPADATDAHGSTRSVIAVEPVDSTGVATVGIDTSGTVATSADTAGTGAKTAVDVTAVVDDPLGPCGARASSSLLHPDARTATVTHAVIERRMPHAPFRDRDPLLIALEQHG
jgi:hypothetical protein